MWIQIKPVYRKSETGGRPGSKNLFGDAKNFPLRMQDRNY